MYFLSCTFGVDSVLMGQFQEHVPVCVCVSVGGVGGGGWGESLASKGGDEVQEHIYGKRLP